MTTKTSNRAKNKTAVKAKTTTKKSKVATKSKKLLKGKPPVVVKLSIAMPKKLHQQLLKIAKADKITISELIRNNCQSLINKV